MKTGTLHHKVRCNFKHKAQYEFIHYALSELVVCGETEIAAANLRSFTDSLRDMAEGSGSTISQQHMTVCFRLFLISDGFVLLV